MDLFYRQGIGVAIDEKKAMHYFKLAAMGENVYARHNIGCFEGHLSVLSTISRQELDIRAL